MRIIPSLASADPLDYRNLIKKLGSSGSLHLDIEDGNFIPNITFGMKTIRYVCSEASLPLNAHLEVTNPLDYIPDLIKLGIKEISVHIEALPYPLQALNLIRDLGGSPGLAYNFSTPIENGEPFFDDVDFLLIMTSEADARSQDFHPSSLKRIQTARTMLPQETHIWVDGGINETNLPLVKEAGADTAVMGRAVVLDEDPVARIKYFSEL